MKTLKYFLIIVFSALIHANIFSQENKVSNDEWNILIKKLTDEKWTDAEKISFKYLNRFTNKDDSIAEPAILRYMYLRCVAAKLGEKEYSKEEALKKVEKFIGKTILTPPKLYISKGLFNCFTLNDDSTHLYSCSSNTTMTVIQIFETYQMNDSTIIEKAKNGYYNNKKLRIGAKIKEIKAGGMVMPRLDILFEDAFIWEEE